MKLGDDGPLQLSLACGCADIYSDRSCTKSDGSCHRFINDWNRSKIEVTMKLSDLAVALTV